MDTKGNKFCLGNISNDNLECPNTSNSIYILRYLYKNISIYIQPFHHKQELPQYLHFKQTNYSIQLEPTASTKYLQ